MRAADSRDALERWPALLACAPVSDRVFPDPHERLNSRLSGRDHAAFKLRIPCLSP